MDKFEDCGYMREQHINLRSAFEAVDDARVRFEDTFTQKSDILNEVNVELGSSMRTVVRFELVNRTHRVGLHTAGLSKNVHGCVEVRLKVGTDSHSEITKT